MAVLSVLPPELWDFPKPTLPDYLLGCRIHYMSTINEIEAAIERLPADQMDQLFRWLAARVARAENSRSTPVELSTLIGSWQEDPAFDAALLALEQVDEELWR